MNTTVRLYKKACPMESRAVTHAYVNVAMRLKIPGHGSFLHTILRVFNFLIAFTTSLEGSIIKMKPTTPVSVDTALSLKA